uniref:C2 domain-containing protein n=1 Tax=Acrobeloides nanus TaxID=290746 RepID=A0A914DVS1_9BILA
MFLDMKEMSHDSTVGTEPLKFSTTFKSCESTSKFRVFLYRLDKPNRVYACTCFPYANTFNLYNLRKRKVNTNNVYWPEFFKDAFIERSYDEMTIVLQDFFYDAKMIFKKGNKKVQLVFHKVNKKQLSFETFAVVNELKVRLFL